MSLSLSKMPGIMITNYVMLGISHEKLGLIKKV